ncbi:HAD family hydrolase [Bifidobacterium sp.]|jgi:FMN phosphatase YigB (HAD superfamily)|uniref:HAD family hydrolase n=1 Tax=Bifidobacterium sp. TaxID=41200 RepID=UPI0025C3DB10|nr:HAD family hydrolase [Bifidobacterium sp.]MCH4209364.1 haloacid dehalogenase-like hydrolase [Bifidobacterium sp.]MCI1225160.1 haloacid dehalogenase-like hydrolase [Bifidobacterium sp.]
MTLAEQSGAQSDTTPQSPEQFDNHNHACHAGTRAHNPATPPAVASPEPAEGTIAGTVVFDFDGTLCLGDGPVWSYAEHAYANLEPELRHEAEAALDGYLAGTMPAQTRETHGWQDGYDVVASFCRDRMAPQRLQEAYLASRAELAAGSASVHMPDGMKDFLRRLGVLGCKRILLSNSPITGLRETLERFGVTDDIDTVVPNGGKPSQWPQHLADFTEAAGSGHLLSIGDYWTNDIEPVLATGYEVAYIHDSEPSGAHDRPTYQASKLPQMYDAILEGCAAWLR